MNFAAPRTPLLRRFGRTGLAFPEIGLGTWTFSGRDFGPIAEENCMEVIRAALGAGVRFFDTADVYGHGRVERLLTAGLSGDPGAAFVSTKVGNDFREGQQRSRKNLDPDYLEAAIGACARRLERPVVDLVHLHNPPPEALADGQALERLARLKRDGRIRLVGLSTADAVQVREAAASPLIDVVQIPFNLLRQELFLTCEPWLRRSQVAVVIRTPLEFGLLGGALPRRQDLATEDYRRRAWTPEEEAVRREAAVALKSVLEVEGHRSLAQAALQFALLPACVSVAIPGSRDLAQLRENLAASRDVPPLETGALRRVHAILREAGLPSGIPFLLGGRSSFAAGNRNCGAIPAAIRRLAEPLRMGPLLVPNRILRSGTTERAVDEAGLPTPAMEQIHLALARGGAGMVITGFLAVEPTGRASTSHGVLADGSAAKAWRSILQACRKSAPEVRICAQLGHGGSLSPETLDPRDKAELFAQAAGYAAEAGFDAVQLHAAHGYLLNQWLAARPALRDCDPVAHWGLEQVAAVVRAVRQAVTPDLAVLVKANMSDFFAGGYDAADAEVVARALAELEVDAVEWSAWIPAAGAAQSPSRPGSVELRSEGFFVPFASRVKARYPGLVMGTCGGFRSASGMARAITGAGLDFVSLSRPLIAEPDLPRRILAGRQDCAFCDGCNQCLPRAVRPLHCPRLTTREVA